MYTIYLIICLLTIFAIFFYSLSLYFIKKKINLAAIFAYFYSDFQFLYKMNIQNQEEKFWRPPSVDHFQPYPPQSLHGISAGDSIFKKGFKNPNQVHPR